ncbi:hypothetical protein K505DRAFT_145842 [Melanomma pulvis-pyrius CBS 109.77]|uniref:Uncharacterized protein n=1 Tax=Melanomma pulvis-pyrius CBS 109.77 TaxID=1314802 RepID=A0A6A6XL48_9PLEO|nr:hypothetical protein K505DRAFT_145842 [Melanomma pulvis-pyrius CBS 109.77]
MRVGCLSIYTHLCRGGLCAYDIGDEGFDILTLIEDGQAHLFIYTCMHVYTCVIVTMLYTRKDWPYMLYSASHFPITLCFASQVSDHDHFCPCLSLCRLCTAGLTCVSSLLYVRSRWISAN